jgi:hypothetical protein
MSITFEEAWRAYMPNVEGIRAFRLPDSILPELNDAAMEFIIELPSGGFTAGAIQKSLALEEFEAGRFGELMKNHLLTQAASGGQPLKAIYEYLATYPGTR